MMLIWGVLGHMKNMQIFRLVLLIGMKNHLWFFKPFFASLSVWKTQQMTFLVLKSVRGQQARKPAGMPHTGQERQEKAVTPLLDGGSRSHKAAFGAVTALSCEIHPNFFRITEVQKPSVEKISLVIQPTLVLGQDCSTHCTGLSRLIWYDSGNGTFHHFLWEV